MLFSTFTPSVPVNITTAQNTTLYAWGDATGGQLGTGTTISQSQPVAVSNFLNGQSFAQIATGISHNLAIDTTGGLWAWGRNSSGQLGTGTTINAANPVKISVSGLVTAPATWTSISLGFTSLAIRSDGTLWAWGYGNRGGLGDGTTVSKSSPVQIGTSSWTMVSTGYDQSAAIDITGRLFVWGGGFTIPAGHGSIGDGTTLSYSSPVQIGTSSWSFVNLGQKQCSQSTDVTVFPDRFDMILGFVFAGQKLWNFWRFNNFYIISVLIIAALVYWFLRTGVTS